jgi:hypothetical protein
MKRLAIALVILFTVSLTFAQPPQPTFQDELLDHFQGHWVMRGIIMNKQTIQDVDAQWVLGHQYLRFTETAREKDAKGQPVYDAEVFLGWDQSTSRYLAIWLDVWGGFGKATVGYAPRTGDEIRYLFNDGKSDFHTTFIYDRKADTWEWRMDNEDNGKLTPFARVKLTRT